MDYDDKSLVVNSRGCGGLEFFSFLLYFVAPLYLTEKATKLNGKIIERKNFKESPKNARKESRILVRLISSSASKCHR